MNPFASDTKKVHPMPTPPDLRIVRVEPAARVQAAAALLRAPADLPAAEQFIEYARANSIGLDLMWSQVDDRGRAVATMLAVPNPGRTAMIFASNPRRPEETDLFAPLIDHGCRAISWENVRLAQTLLDPGEALARRMFLASGFTPLADLSYLERATPPPGRAPAPAWPPGFSTEPYRDTLREVVLDVLAASYHDTLDCPGLGGLRSTEDILAGHMGTGEFDPALWTVLFHRDRACGVLMLNRAPAGNTIELVYLGLRPELRGQSLGRQLLRHGLTLIAGRRERAVSLAVDDRNAPAIALYHRERFRRILRRAALIRALPEPA